jgi:ABC-2 type transport system ATP-binding protein
MCKRRRGPILNGMNNTHANRDHGGPAAAIARPHDGPAVQTLWLSKRFGPRTAVDDVTLTVPRGTAYGFLGHNGAGKTTLIRMLLGLTRASAGSASVLGLPVPAQRAQALARVGAIVEEPSFYPHLTGRENLKVAAAIRGPEARPRIDAALHRVGLDQRAGDRVSTYSLGMRQRLGVARCLLSDPELLILDEPMNGLDPGGMLEMRRMIRGLVEEEGRTVFVSSHLLDEVEKTCDLAAIIDGGRVLAQGPIAELVADGAGELLVECDDAERALALLASDPSVHDLRRDHGGLRMRLLYPEQAGEINARLVGAGVAVTRLEPVRHTLEERFLEMTTRLEVAA